MALAQHGLLRKGVPSSDQLSVKRVDPAKLEVSFLFLCWPNFLSSLDPFRILHVKHMLIHFLYIL